MNRYILDTHSLIWLVESSPNVSTKIRDELKSSNTDVFFERCITLGNCAQN